MLFPSQALELGPAPDGTVQRLLPLARRLARRLRPGDDEALALATLALSDAVERFDGEEGDVVEHALRAVARALRREDLTGEPAWAQTLDRTLEVVAVGLGRSPTAAELAAMLDLDVEDVLDLLEATLVDDGRPCGPRARERRALRMRFAEGLGRDEIARRIDASPLHVSRLLRSALGHERALTRERPGHG